MGKKYESKRSSVKENRESNQKNIAEKSTLSNEYSFIESIEGLLSEVDDGVSDSIIEVRNAGDSETARLEREADEIDKEKEELRQEIEDEIEKLKDGMSTLRQLDSFQFGKKSVEGAKGEYKKQTDNYRDLLKELESDSGESSEIGSAIGISEQFYGGEGHSVEGNADSSNENVSEVGGRLGDWLTDTFSNSSNYSSMINQLDRSNVTYRPIRTAHGNRTQEEIISNLSGGDMTEGSCSSLALAYAGNVAGYEVLDFRDGASRDYFSSRDSIKKVTSLLGVRSITLNGTNDIESANQLLGGMTPGKEYYLATGQHAAIVRNTGDHYEYLELQHPSNGNGWHELDDYMLVARFGASPNHTVTYSNYLIEVESLGQSPEFINVLGYINTAEIDQRKGGSGNVR